MSTARYTAIIVVIGLYVVWSLLLLVYGVPQPEPDGYKELSSQWATALYNYQTLIGGALAILAALITVVAMIALDQKQASRHNQLIRLNLREDKLRLWRLIFPQLNELLAAKSKLEEAAATDQALAAMGISFPQLREYSTSAVKVTNEIGAILANPNWANSVDLFDGPMTDKCNKLIERIGTIRTRNSDISYTINMIASPGAVMFGTPSWVYQLTDDEQVEQSADGDKFAREMLKAEASRLHTDVVDVSAILQTIVDQLRAMACDYEIVFE